MFPLVTDDLLIGTSNQVELGKLSRFIRTIQFWKREKRTISLVNAAPFQELFNEEIDQPSVSPDSKELVEFDSVNSN